MNKLRTRNKKTRKLETIVQHDKEMKDWGFSFFLDSEMEAFKAAYIYRNSPHGTIVEFAQGIGKWMVTVFNRDAISMGIDGAK